MTFWAIWMLVVSVILYLNDKVTKSKRKRYFPQKFPVHAGELWYVSVRGIIFLSREKSLGYIFVKDALITIIEPNAITSELAYAIHGIVFPDALSMGQKSYAHLVLYNCQLYFVSDVFWQTQYMKKV
jgi:hypothetical protein